MKEEDYPVFWKFVALFSGISLVVLYLLLFIAPLQEKIVYCVFV